jgi:L-ascorbate metabolism protein UlaG (beta-lactamase superfamily)
MPELRTAFAGVSNVLVTDGSSAVLVDGFFSRPSLLKLATRVAPDRGRIEEALRRLGITELDAVLVAHSHVDHALDAPVVAELTGATLAGSPSTRKVQEGYGLAAGPFEELVPGRPVEFGAFTVTPVGAEHSAGDRVPGAAAGQGEGLQDRAVLLGPPRARGGQRGGPRVGELRARSAHRLLGGRRLPRHRSGRQANRGMA